VTPPKLDTATDVQAWILTHHAECGQRREHQTQFNTDVEARLRRLETRVLVLAALGATAGSAVSKLLF
jgi:hypothetical protein